MSGVYVIVSFQCREYTCTRECKRDRKQTYDIDRSFVNIMNFNARVLKHFFIYLDIMFNLMFLKLLYVTLDNYVHFVC